MISSLDTIWNYFSTRMGTINPSRALGGLMDAQDWPPKEIFGNGTEVTFDTFYMLVLPESPASKDLFSWSVPIYKHTVQFTWINRGTDVSTATNVLGKNRGDKYRTRMQMEAELLQALYPGFTQKLQLSINGSGALQTQELNQPIMWSQPNFVPRLDKDSGLIYMTATVGVTDYADTYLS